MTKYLRNQVNISAGEERKVQWESPMMLDEGVTIATLLNACIMAIRLQLKCCKSLMLARKILSSSCDL